MVTPEHVYTYKLHSMEDGRFLSELYRDGTYMTGRIAATKEEAMREIASAKALYSTTVIEEGEL